VLLRPVFLLIGCLFTFCWLVPDASFAAPPSRRTHLLPAVTECCIYYGKHRYGKHRYGKHRRKKKNRPGFSGRLEPIIPLPDNLAPDIIFPDSAKKSRKFPAHQFNDFIKSYEKAVSSGDIKYPLIRKHFSLKFGHLAAPTRYSFLQECPLEIVTGKDQKRYLFITCLDKRFRSRLALRRYILTNRRIVQRLRTFEDESRLSGILELRKLKFHEKGIRWLWRVHSLYYSNLYLDFMRRSYPGRSTAFLRNINNVNAKLEEILRIAILPKNRLPHRMDHLEQFLGPGRWLKFTRDCPLSIIKDPSSERGDDRVRISFRIDCLADSTLGAGELTVSEASFNRISGLKSALASGVRIRASLKFREIFYTGYKYYMLWDSIKNIQEYPSDEKDLQVSMPGLSRIKPD